RGRLTGGRATSAHPFGQDDVSGPLVPEVLRPTRVVHPSSPQRIAMPNKNAIQVLEEDHVKVEKAFEQFEKLGDEDSEQKQQIVSTVLSDLKVHTVIEEELFYPPLLQALKGNDDEIEDLLDEAEVEHTSAKELIAQIQAMDPEERLYDAKFTVLCEYVKHHVKEERNEIFPKAKRSDLDLDAIGEQLENRKMELKQMLADEEAGMSARKGSGGRRASSKGRPTGSKSGKSPSASRSSS